MAKRTPLKHHKTDDNVSASNLLDQLKKTIPATPLQSGGSNFKTHVLTNPSKAVLNYKPSYGTALFCWLFFSIGLALLFFGIRTLILSDLRIQFSLLLMLGIGMVFTLTGALMFYGFYKPIVFDKTQRLFIKGYTKNKSDKSNYHVPFDDIIAIQVIGERIKGEKNNFNSFELNLVLKNGTRKNVIDHGNLSAIVNDARTISDFLDVPIWHAKSNST